MDEIRVKIHVKRKSPRCVSGSKSARMRNALGRRIGPSPLNPSGASKINVTPDLSRVPPLQPPSTPLHPFPSISTLFPSWTYFSPLITAAAAGTGKEGRQGIEGKGVAT